MSDIVERLRRHTDGVIGDMLMDEAADEIERQTLIIQNLELELERSKTKNASLYNLLATINKQGSLDYDTHDRITTAISITPT